MSLAKAQSAIITRYDAADFGLTTFYPGVNYDPAARTAHCRIWFIPVGNDAGSLGRGGIDRISGIAQFDLMYPDGNGVGEALEMADNIAARFLRGYSQDYSGTDVVFTGGTVLSPRNENGWLRVPVSVGWYVNQSRVNYSLPGVYPLDADSTEVTGIGFLAMTLTEDDQKALIAMTGAPGANRQAVAFAAGAASGTSATVGFDTGKKAIEWSPVLPASVGGGSATAAWDLELTASTVAFSTMAQVKFTQLANGTKTGKVYLGASLVYSATLGSFPSRVGVALDANTSTARVYFDDSELTLTPSTFTPAEAILLIAVYEKTASPAGDAGKFVGAQLYTQADTYTGTTYPAGTTDIAGNNL